MDEIERINKEILANRLRLSESKLMDQIIEGQSWGVGFPEIKETLHIVESSVDPIVSRIRNKLGKKIVVRKNFVYRVDPTAAEGLCTHKLTRRISRVFPPKDGK